MPAKTQATSLNSPIQPTSVKAQDTDVQKATCKDEKSSANGDTPGQPDGHRHCNDHIPLDVQYMHSE